MTCLLIDPQQIVPFITTDTNENVERVSVINNVDVKKDHIETKKTTTIDINEENVTEILLNVKINVEYMSTTEMASITELISEYAEIVQQKKRSSRKIFRC